TTVTLNATDSGSGVQFVRYSLSGAQTATAINSSNPALVSITMEGTTPLVTRPSTMPGITKRRNLSSSISIRRLRLQQLVLLQCRMSPVGTARIQQLPSIQRTAAPESSPFAIPSRELRLRQPSLAITRLQYR